MGSVTVYQDIVIRIVNGAQSTHYAYTLHGADGAKVTLLGDLIPKAAEWGHAIQNAVTDAQFPAAAAALQRGETLTFGNLSLNADGVVADGKTRPWRQVQKIDVQSGFVSINVQGKWLALSTTAVKQIPNVFVFLTVAEYLRSKAAESTA
jgi:hypothetical protein